MSDLRYHVLFLLDADADLLFEIERLDVQSEQPADVYFWFRFDKASRVLQPLTFIAMSQTEDEQQREFVEGRLAFGPTGGTYQPHPTAPPLVLQAAAAATLFPAAEAAVHVFLAAR